MPPPPQYQQALAPRASFDAAAFAPVDASSLFVPAAASRMPSMRGFDPFDVAGGGAGAPAPVGAAVEASHEGRARVSSRQGGAGALRSREGSMTGRVAFAVATGGDAVADLVSPVVPVAPPAVPPPVVRGLSALAFPVAADPDMAGFAKAERMRGSTEVEAFFSTRAAPAWIGAVAPAASAGSAAAPAPDPAAVSAAAAAAGAGSSSRARGGTDTSPPPKFPSSSPRTGAVPARARRHGRNGEPRV